MPAELPTSRCIRSMHEEEGGCYECCDHCNYDTHMCGGCGEPLTHDGKERSTGTVHEGCTD